MTSTGTCSQCGMALEPGAGFCARCGATVHDDQPAFAATPTTPPPMMAPAPPPPAGPPPPAPPGAGAAGPPPGKRRNPAMIIGGAVAVVALIGTVFVLTSGDDENTAGPASTTVVGGSTTTPGGSTSSVPTGATDPGTLGPGEVFLEPVNVPTRDPFTEPAVGPAGEAPPTVSLPDIPLPSTSTTVEAGGPVATPQVTGNNPGLYGGTRDAAACDQEAMIAFLEANPDKAAAWAGVQGIAVADIRAYIDDLTPVILTRDTRVTNHGFRNGQAYAHPSVLQRGHAVLVDRWGVPRAKCSCGNPLAPPVPLDRPPIYVGDPWPDFDVTVIIIVVAGDPVDDEGFVLVDLTTGELIIRGTGANPDTPDLATGDIRVTLRWNDAADLDLAVTDPFGDTVSYGNRAVASGGSLDVDANSGCNSVMAAPAENIVWSGTPPDGVYVITIDDYSDCNVGESHQFELTVLVGGVPVQISDASGALAGVGTVTGVVGSGAPTTQYSFTMGAGGPTGPTDPGGEYSDPATASATILDLLLLDCGVEGTFIDGGPVEGNGYRWIVSTPSGDASFVVYEPLGSWFVEPEDDLAAAIAVSCGFYTP